MKAAASRARPDMVERDESERRGREALRLVGTARMAGAGARECGRMFWHPLDGRLGDVGAGRVEADGELSSLRDSDRVLVDVDSTPSSSPRQAWPTATCLSLPVLPPPPSRSRPRPQTSPRARSRPRRVRLPISAPESISSFFPDTPQRQCRNILIYGCVPPSPAPTPSSHRPDRVSFRTRAVSTIILRCVPSTSSPISIAHPLVARRAVFRVRARCYMPLGCPSHLPSSPDSPTLSAALPAQAVNAPVFVPKGHPGSPSLSAAVPASIQQQASVSSYVSQCSQPHTLPKQASPSPSRPSSAVWALCAHRMLNRLSVTPPPPNLLLPSYRSNRTNKSSILTQNNTILTTLTPMQSIMATPPMMARRW